jgi:hypothetical protein
VLVTLAEDQLGFVVVKLRVGRAHLGRRERISSSQQRYPNHDERRAYPADDRDLLREEER